VQFRAGVIIFACSEANWLKDSACERYQAEARVPTWIVDAGVQ